MATQKFVGAHKAEPPFLISKSATVEVQVALENLLTLQNIEVSINPGGDLNRFIIIGKHLEPCMFVWIVNHEVHVSVQNRWFHCTAACILIFYGNSIILCKHG